jgi:hypothetical protein
VTAVGLVSLSVSVDRHAEKDAGQSDTEGE